MELTRGRHCAACYGQYTEMDAVDFQAAYDGPVLDTEGQIKVAIDDLVICRTCLTRAGELLGLTDADKTIAAAQQVLDTVDTLYGERDELVKVVNSLRHTLDVVLGARLEKPGGRPKLELTVEQRKELGLRKAA